MTYSKHHIAGAGWCPRCKSVKNAAGGRLSELVCCDCGQPLCQQAPRESLGERLERLRREQMADLRKTEAKSHEA